MPAVAHCLFDCYCSLLLEQLFLPATFELLKQSGYIQAMASRSARAWGDNTHSASSAFEHELDKISKAYTGDEEEVEERINCFLESAREIALEAGLGKAANGSAVGQWQPNKDVSEEHLQAALDSLDSVCKVLAVLNHKINTAGSLKRYLVSTFCRTTSSLTSCNRCLISAFHAEKCARTP